MNMKYKNSLILLLSVLMLCCATYADQKEFYKTDVKYLEENNFGNPLPMLSMNYRDGTFDVYPFNDNYNVLVYNKDPNHIFAVKKLNDYLLTFPYNGEKLSLFMTRNQNTSTGRAYGFVDKKGELVVEPKYEWGDYLFNGVAVMGMFEDASKKEARYCLVDENGKQITDLKYQFIDRFMLPKSFINRASRHTFSGFKSDFFKDYEPLDYACFAKPFQGNITVGTMQRARKFPTPQKADLNQKGVMDKRGVEVIPPIYFDVRIGDNDIVAVAPRRLEYGYINLDGEVLLPAQYQLTTRFRNGKAAIVKDDKLAFIDENFSVIQDFKPTPYWRDIYYLGDIDLLVQTYFDGVSTTSSNWARPNIAMAEGIDILDDEMKSRYKKNITRAEFAV